MSMFDGPGAAAVGLVMARMNREAELEAVERLAPSPFAKVLVIGFGPGVGLQALACRVSDGLVFDVDPSRMMHA